MHLVIEENAAAWLQLVLVYEAEYGHVVLATHAGGDDGVVVINDLLQVANTHGCSSQDVHLATFLLVLLLLGLQSLLVPDELLLHQEIILDPLLLEKPQPALCMRGDPGQLISSIRPLDTLALLTDPGGHGWLVLLLLLLLPLVLPLPLLILTAGFPSLKVFSLVEVNQAIL